MIKRVSINTTLNYHTPHLLKTMPDTKGGYYGSKDKGSKEPGPAATKGAHYGGAASSSKGGPLNG